MYARRLPDDDRARRGLTVGQVAWRAGVCNDRRPRRTACVRLSASYHDAGVPTRSSAATRWMDASTSTPLRARSHDVSESEFHMSALWNSSRPQTGLGTSGTRSRIRWARASSAATLTGLATASLASAIEPSRHRPNLVSKQAESASPSDSYWPLATTPRSSS